MERPRPGNRTPAQLLTYGLLIEHHGSANVPFNTADNWLHFVLGVGMIGLGFATTRVRSPLPAT